MKIDISQVVEALKHEHAEPALLRAVIERLNQRAADEAGDEEEKAPAVKKQYCVLVSDPHNDMPKHDLVAWIVRIPESESPATVQDRINRAVYDFNASKKGRLQPAKTVSEAMEFVPAKFHKEAELWIATKEPVLVLKTNNLIPKDESK